ncbi:kinesin motor domain-containing protein [Anopheles sinensis]|uniref:Kinesin motor domain-containing protein n=1 Tax=Anopheles sinensis TaxID=74873 RepID=A0A084VIN0_ANOSI|nr:kinesin motor domain-containing protein [Anopheles sinensis]
MALTESAPCVHFCGGSNRSVVVRIPPVGRIRGHLRFLLAFCARRRKGHRVPAVISGWLRAIRAASVAIRCPPGSERSGEDKSINYRASALEVASPTIAPPQAFR